jgi:hypothetical protein
VVWGGIVGFDFGIQRRNELARLGTSPTCAFINTRRPLKYLGGRLGDEGEIGGRLKGCMMV